MERASKLIVLDIDNTVFNWVEYYVSCLQALLERVHALTGIPVQTLYSEARTVFEREGSIEYPFLIQELPSVIAFFGQDIEGLLQRAVEPGRKAFNQEAESKLVPYGDVIPTLAELKSLYPSLPVIALTDAPRYVAMWKLNKLGLLSFFDAVYGLPDPRVPTDPATQKVKVDGEILIKHLQKSNFGFTGRIRILPDDYEKPGTKGLKTVLMDYEMESHRADVLWVGDNLRKDVGLGRSLGVHTGWARYGTNITDEAKRLLLQFSPESNVHKNVALDPQNHESPRPDFILECFADLLIAVERTIQVSSP